MNRTFNRTIAFGAFALSGAMLLAACGGSSNGGSSSSASNSTSGSSNVACVDGSIKAAGSSAQANAIAEWITDYQTTCSGATIDYQAVGSGAGVEAFNSKQVSFAGTDSAVKDADLATSSARCAAGPAINIPMVGGAIAVAYNVAGVDKLILDPTTIAKIFASAITKWNDPAIVALNPGVTLPDAPIAQFHRSDSSGTTDNFTKYLIAQAPAVWTFTPGKDWSAPGGQGAKGSDQVIASVDNTANSIGYVELSFVQDAKNAKAAWVDNGAGAVEATSANAATTIAKATIKGTGNDLALSIDYSIKAADAYPLVLVTYEFTCQAGLSAAEQPALVKSFLTYTSSDAAQAMLTEAGYVPITGDLLTKVRASVAALAS